MSWLLGIIVIAFILAMVVYWATQGLFSALLHLGLVITAGALAFAIWQPLTVGLLLGHITAYAWGVGLLAPFALLLIVLRVIADKLIAGNVQLPNLVNSLGGGVLGGFSGFLTAGIVLIGFGFLPLSPSILGYQAYGPGPKGVKAVASAFMPVPVITGTAAFYDALSHGAGITGGAFSTSTPLAQRMPDLAKLSSLYRMRADPNASLAATPDSVDVTAIQSVPGKRVGLPASVAHALGPIGKNQKLVVVQTKWHAKKGVFDPDSTLRMTSTQIRLITADAANHSQPKLQAPIAAHWIGPRGHQQLTVFDATHKSAYAFKDGAMINWIFRLPQTAKPKLLLVRTLPMSLPSHTGKKPAALARAIGHLPKPSKPKKNTGPRVGKRRGMAAGEKATKIVQTNRLTQPFRKSDASNISFSGHAITGTDGQGIAIISYGGPSHRTMVNQIYLPDQFAMVRLKVTPDRAKSFLAQTLQFAASVSAPLLKDSQGNVTAPIAYVLVKGSGKKELIEDRFAPFQSAKQIPFNQMHAGDKMYLYFRVSHGITITSYQLSPRTHQRVHLKVK